MNLHTKNGLNFHLNQVNIQKTMSGKSWVVQPRKIWIKKASSKKAARATTKMIPTNSLSYWIATLISFVLILDFTPWFSVECMRVDVRKEFVVKIFNSLNYDKMLRLYLRLLSAVLEAFRILFIILSKYGVHVKRKRNSGTLCYFRILFTFSAPLAGLRIFSVWGERSWSQKGTRQI